MAAHDPFDLEGQNTKQLDAVTSAENARANELADVKWLMSCKRGRRIVWRHLEQTGVYRSTFSPTAMIMAFNEGNRNAGNRALDLVMRACPELYTQMMKENTDGRRADRDNSQ